MKLIESLGFTLLHSLWQGALVAVLLAVLMLIFSRQSAQFRYFVAVTAMFTMFLLAVITFCNLYFSKTQPIQVLNSAFSEKNLQDFDKQQLTENAIVLTAESEIQISFAEKCMLYFQEHLPLIVIIWLSGVLILTLRFIGALAYVQRIRYYRTFSVSEEWLARTQEIAQNLGFRRSVSLVESALAKVPMAIGYLKPIILLPVGTLTGLPVAQIEGILAHELAHVVRNDYWLNLLQSVLEIVFFFHPAIWWMSKIVRQERENCCDDLAVSFNGNSLVFAQALANLAVFQTSPTLAMAANKGSLLPRIQRLIQKAPQKPTFTEGLLASGIVLMCLLAVSVSAFAQWQQEKPEKTAFDKSEEIVTGDTILYFSNRAVDKTSFEDTTKKLKELIVIKNKKGKVTDVIIDGKHLPKEQLKDYEKYVEKALKEADEKGEWRTQTDDFMIEIPAPINLPALPDSTMWIITPEPPFPPDEIELLLLEEDKKLKKLEKEFQKDIRIKKLENEALYQKEILEYQRNLAEKQVKITKIDAENARKQAENARKEAKIAKENHEKIWKELGAELKKDGLIKDEEHFSFKIMKTELFVNGKKQPQPVFEKYKKWLKEKNRIDVDEFKEKSSFEISTDGSSHINIKSKDINVSGYSIYKSPGFAYAPKSTYKVMPRTQLYGNNGNTLFRTLSPTGFGFFPFPADSTIVYNEEFDPKEMLITIRFKHSFVKFYKGKENIEIKVEGKYPDFYLNGRKVLFQEIEKLKADNIESIEGSNPSKRGNINFQETVWIRTKDDC